MKEEEREKEKKRRGERGRKRVRSSFSWFILQIPAIAGACPGKSQKKGTPTGYGFKLEKQLVALAVCSAGQSLKTYFTFILSVITHTEAGLKYPQTYV